MLSGLLGFGWMIASWTPSRKAEGTWGWAAGRQVSGGAERVRAERGEAV